MRRVLEVYERQQKSLHVLFLDWSKAFDSVSFSSIESSLRFFGVPPLFVDSILRVLNPTNEDCSNSYLASLSYDSSRVITPSQIYSQNRLTLLGHLFRHPNSLEFSSTFRPSGQYRYTRGPNRVGRPRLHWAESVMSEASNRISHLTSDQAPLHSDIDNSFFKSLTPHMYD